MTKKGRPKTIESKEYKELEKKYFETLEQFIKKERKYVQLLERLTDQYLESQ